MIIKINNKNEVTTIIEGLAESFVKADNKQSFKVESVPPTVYATEVLCYSPEDRVFYTTKREGVPNGERAKALAEASEKAQAALKWLSDNDWKVNKRMLGEWAENDERWLEYLAGREQARKDYDEATEILKGISEKTAAEDEAASE